MRSTLEAKIQQQSIYIFVAELHQRNTCLARVTCSCRLVASLYLEGWTYFIVCNEQLQYAILLLVTALRVASNM